MFAVSYLSRFIQIPTTEHFLAAKRIIRYLRATSNVGLHFTYSDAKSVNLVGFSDGDQAGCIDDSKITSGYVFSIENGSFCGNLKKQETTAQSAVEAKYTAAATAANQAIWMRKVLVDLGFLHVSPAGLYVDTKSAIAMAKNPVFHNRTKHIKVNAMP